MGGVQRRSWGVGSGGKKRRFLCVVVRLAFALVGGGRGSVFLFRCVVCCFAFVLWFRRVSVCDVPCVSFCVELLCLALLCFGLLCFALLRCALLSFDLLCFDLLCFALLGSALLCYVWGVLIRPSWSSLCAKCQVGVVFLFSDQTMMCFVGSCEWFRPSPVFS